MAQQPCLLIFWKGMVSIFLLVGEKPPERDEQEEIDNYNEIFHALGQCVEFVKYVRHILLLPFLRLMRRQIGRSEITHPSQA